MAELKIPDGIPKPFANYDVVVYFGGALFSLPFINRYLVQPLGARFPNFDIEFGTKIASEAVAVLSSLFTIYIVGHLLAYVASQVIEKTTDRFLGKISSAILVSSYATRKSRNYLIRALIYSKIKQLKSKRSRMVTAVRMFLHAPAIPIYIIIFTAGIFGYYDTRLSRDMRIELGRKYQKVISSTSSVSINAPWFKSMEYYVINRHPGAIPRMYNYLVISGLFRTLSLIFLISSWAVVYFSFHYYFHGDWLIKPLFSITVGNIGFVEFVILITLYVFCLFSYIKFQRRYAEEAIFAFIFAPD